MNASFNGRQSPSRRNVLRSLGHSLAAGALLALSVHAKDQSIQRPVIKVPKDFKTLGEAFAALPDSGGVIELAAGTYREKLSLSKTDVHIIGMAKRAEDVIIVWGDSAKMAGGTGKSASLTVTGDGFRASYVTIANDYNHNADPSQAVALYLTSDRAVLHNVRLLGAQDTLYAASKKPTQPSRQYFKACYIEGHVDFIFGNGLAFFDRCHIHILERSNAFITAHSRTAPSETTAYVFDHCKITSKGEGDYYLGRAWRPYAQVIFLDSQIEGTINPEGWREWTPGKTETYATAHFAEYGTKGKSADLSARAFWVDRLSKEEAAKWRLSAVFPDQSWIGHGQ